MWNASGTRMIFQKQFSRQAHVVRERRWRTWTGDDSLPFMSKDSRGGDGGKGYCIVSVEGGKVVSVEFTNENDTVENLNKTLKVATRDLRVAYPAWKSKSYPDGDYLSGLFYAEEKDRYLPLENGEKDDGLFYQTWLQIIAGNEARNLTEKEMDERCKQVVDGYHQDYNNYLKDSKFYC